MKTDSIMQNWLEAAIERAISNNWCTTLYCTTCGAGEFRDAIFGYARAKTNSELNGGVVADYITEALSAVELRPERKNYKWVEAIRFIILELNNIQGEEYLTQKLGTGWAGQVLRDMQKHYQAKLEKRRRQEEEHSPVLAQKRREEQRLRRQQQHREMLKRQKEKAIIWHANNEKTQ